RMRCLSTWSWANLAKHLTRNRQSSKRGLCFFLSLNATTKMELQPATRKTTKVRLALSGLSGTGKTYSALLLAYGLCGDWSRIAVIDTEEESATLCSFFGPFHTVQIAAPFHPSKFEEAMMLCEEAGMEVIIIDSLTPEWSGEGGVAELLKGADYEEALRNHRIVLSNISQSTAHVICTLRAKRRIVCEETGGKRHPMLMEIPDQQEGIEYPFTTVLKLDRKHLAHVVKDRTGIFRSKLPFIIEVEVGNWLHRWCKQQTVSVPAALLEKINACQTMEELLQLLMTDEVSEVEYVSAFTKRRLELMGIPHVEEVPERASSGTKEAHLRIV
ncbi:hypothetical protein EON64_17810, partial [archaeon]